MLLTEGIVKDSTILLYLRHNNSNVLGISLAEDHDFVKLCHFVQK